MLSKNIFDIKSFREKLDVLNKIIWKKLTKFLINDCFKIIFRKHFHKTYFK